MPSPARVARAHAWRKMAATESINRFIEAEWLPAIGSEIVRRVGGSFKVDFKQGYVLKVVTGRADTVEIIGIRVSLSYRSGSSTMYLYSVVDGDSQEMDSMESGTFFKLKPRDVAEWAVDATAGRGQTDLPFTPRQRRSRNLERARVIVNQDPKTKDLPWRKKQPIVEEVLAELEAGTRR